MAKNVIGLDIGTAGLRAVELSDVGRAKPTLVRYHELELPPGVISKGEVVEPNTVAHAIKRLWSAGGFSSKNVVLGVGNHRVLARDLSVPRASQRGIRESLPFQVQDMIPVPVSEALLDFYPHSESIGEGGIPQVNGLLIAAVKDAVMTNVKAAQLGGLNPVGVELIPFALSRLHLRGESGAGTSAVLDLGAHTTTVVISTNGIPQFVRIIPTGSDDLTQTLKAQLEIDAVTAESMKRRVGLAPGGYQPDDEQAVTVIYEVTNELLTSIRNTIMYFSNTRPNQPVHQVILSGGGGGLPGFANALSETLRLPVVEGDPFGSFTVARKGRAGTAAAGSAAVAAGLAMGSAA
ncbi:type IV pilus assembly protein PilM [Orlajensenia leifsoniae]|uniref:Type IV pilus assembly protein PilM n=1 Tax=Orlajensenia leifsoniae TaxID=2561933 RepID=A0A4Y9R8E5_9MICO|nr:type IV pilus assembly protein PilM [Leifsonia flava]TFW00123.1 type IV pilus assembly protein PilM [Leifsonia flava]